MVAENSTWSSATNWTVAHGSLDSSVSFDSSLSPIDNPIDSSPKSPLLLLHPTSPDSCPCEIKISFTQKHEVRQVYVRSTARVYEIYYGVEPQSCNEYLCTVRCSIAAKDAEVLHVIDTEEAVSAQLIGSSKQLAEEKSKSDSSISTNEDDWIEVKVPDSPLLDNRNRSLPTKIDTHPGRGSQDFYEATAEITDANPCISLTVRLLSLENKGCVHVDEVYVFADPVELADSENEVGRVESSSGSSLMAMLAPTLLQLSKTGISRAQEKQASDSREKQMYQEIGIKATDSTNIASKIQQEGKSSIADEQEVNGATAEPPRLQIPTQVPDTEKKLDSIAKENYLPNSHIERALDQLVSRVGRIEDTCLRFEENMLKPISSMEARLQRVEQQLEVLSKKSQYSGFPSCTRISAPEFPCNGSDSNSFYDGGSDYPGCGALELDKNNFPSDKVSIPPDDMSVSVDAAQLLPGLVVTAPEFSYGDDEEENDALEPVRDSPRDKPKQALSIDDALASALAGFLSSTSIQPAKYTQTLTVKAPEFPIDEDGNDDKLTSPRVENEIPVIPSICLSETNGTECVNNSVSPSCNTSSVESTGQGMRFLNDDHFEEITEGIDGQGQLYEEGTGCSSPTTDVDVDYPLAQNDVLNQYLRNQTEDSSNATQEGGLASTDITSAKDVEEGGSDKDMLQNVLKFSCSSIVDFEVPILDVKFVSRENSHTKYPLESLLTDILEPDVEAPCVKESDDGNAVVEQSNLILVEDGEPMVPVTDNHLLVDLDNYNVRDVPSNMGSETPQDPFTSSNQEMFASLI